MTFSKKSPGRWVHSSGRPPRLSATPHCATRCGPGCAWCLASRITQMDSEQAAPAGRDCRARSADRARIASRSSALDAEYSSRHGSRLSAGFQRERSQCARQPVFSGTGTGDHARNSEPGAHRGVAHSRGRRQVPRNWNRRSYTCRAWSQNASLTVRFLETAAAEAAGVREDVQTAPGAGAGSGRSRQRRRTAAGGRAPLCHAVAHAGWACAESDHPARKNR